MGEGLWCEIAGRDFAHRPALFLDRDGVLVEDAHYLGRAEDVRMLEGAPAAPQKNSKAFRRPSTVNQSCKLDLLRVMLLHLPRA